MFARGCEVHEGERRQDFSNVPKRLETVLEQSMPSMVDTKAL